MPEFVKIKKSKNLRFKLINLMYLVFLMLSLIQIPTGWLPSNAYMYSFLHYPISEYNSAYLKNTSEKLSSIESKVQLAIGYDSLTKKIKEPNAYAPTDLYFIKNNGASEIFTILCDLNKWVNKVNTDTVIQNNFNLLFEEDLQNGIEDENLSTWQNWKWKHVPAVLAHNLYKELILRVDLLSYQSKIDMNPILLEKQKQQQKETEQEAKLVLLSENGKLRIGETLKFHLYQDSLVQLKITKNKQIINSYTTSGDTILFTPHSTGEFKIEITGNKLNQIIDVEVLSAPIVDEKNNTLRLAYAGVNYAQNINFGIPNSNLYINGVLNSKITDNTLSYVPENIGWNLLQVKSKNEVLLSDSIYVKPLPEPYIQIKDLPNLKISKKRLSQLEAIQLNAMHPSFDEHVFKIESFEAKWPGTSFSTKTINGEVLPISKELKSENISYLIISNIVVKAGNKNITLTDPIVVKIL